MNTYDVVIVGAGAAGLNAALLLTDADRASAFSHEMEREVSALRVRSPLGWPAGGQAISKLP